MWQKREVVIKKIYLFILFYQNYTGFVKIIRPLSLADDDVLSITLFPSS